MKLKFLLFVFLLCAGAISAQDTINYLVITEFRGTPTQLTYLELTNMGDKPVQLNQFEIGHWGGGATLDYATGKTNRDGYMIPMDYLLQPGESYVFAAVAEYGPKKFAQGLPGFPEKQTQDNMLTTADFLVYLVETPNDGTDIFTPGLSAPFNEQWGANGFFIEQHFPNGDSIVVDQVMGMFTGANGANLDRTAVVPRFDIAGVTEGTANCYLIRKFSVKQGNLDFNSARGVGLDDSEWIPIPIHDGAYRLAPWTVGNQGDYNLDANTLESDIITVDFAAKTLTVPWGVQRGDDIMRYFKQKPGIGWEYLISPVAEDSLSHACATGDQLVIYVCGNDLDKATFNIIVKDPTAGANMVVPVSNQDPQGYWRDQIDNGTWDWPRVTQHESGIDSIWGIRGGIPYGTRVDSLLERLAKPANAKWEIVYASGTAKPDLVNGDKLKVTAENGSVKDYFISVLPYRANNNSYLTSITWPDIPEFYKGIFGWIGDTIPNFGSQVFNYNIQVPLMSEGIPALVSTKSDVNATVHVDRAKSLYGSEMDRTVTFTVTAEDDSTISQYSVILTKEKNPEFVQPNRAEPFISEVVNNYQWTGTDYMEIVNPGNQVLDLSNYMVVGYNNINPATAIAQTQATNWPMRYEKYIPGYKWAPNATEWSVQPYIAQTDIAVNALVEPGDVFCMGLVKKAECDWPTYPLTSQFDVQFWDFSSPCYTWKNQWGETVAENGTPFSKWHTETIFLFKILNDSIKRGLKSATDPNDFELIDAVGMTDGSLWMVDGKGIGNPFSIRRKPEIYKGNPVVGATMGSADVPGEWTFFNTNVYAAQGFGWPWNMRNITTDLGKHFYNTPTQYMSTVSSLVYKVSDGYSMNERIKGVKTGTTVSDFLGSLIKPNENQSLKVNKAGTGAELGMDALLNMNDVLTVLSADSTNTTKYVLEVSEAGLSSDAVLTSNRYKITIDAEPKSAGEVQTDGSGSVSGFEYGTSLKTVLNNVTVPPGASMTVINGEGAFVPLKQLNFDTVYVNITVNADTYLEVTAENGTTRIIYQLMPQSSASAAFVTSDLYSVVQKELLIEFVPRGITVQNFLSNLVPSYKASLKLVDKMGFERMDGTVADDDKLVVTSADGKKTVVYHISKLATQYTPQTTYLAYILSNIYGIDQVVYKIDGVSGTATISEFYSNIKVATGATAVVVNKDGAVKTSGDIDGTDMVKVTSADGKINVMYTFGQLTSAEWLNTNQVELYPNPFNGKLNVAGVQKGQRIQVYNSVGVAIVDINVESNLEIINLDKHPAGLYLIVISDRNQPIGKYKAIKY